MDYNPIPFDHTYILYDPDDILSVASVHFSLLPIYIMVFYTAWFLITREIEPVIVVGGHLINEGINKVVKCLVRQPRPEFHKDFGIGTYGLSYGMPSAHSQFMGFFATYFVCIVLFRVPIKNMGKLIAVVMLYISCLCVASSRVYLLYHTAAQVAVGVTVGAVFGLVFFIILALARDVGIVDWVILWPLVKDFYIKDSYYHCYETFESEFLSYKARIEKKRNIKT